MLSDFRAWLAAELQLLGNASHHAYSFGQANMAKRALERLDAELGKRVVLPLEPSSASALLAALALQNERDGRLDPALRDLHDTLRSELAEMKRGGPAEPASGV